MYRKFWKYILEYINSRCFWVEKIWDKRECLILYLYVMLDVIL